MLVCDVPCDLVTLPVMPFCCFAPAVIVSVKIRTGVARPALVQLCSLARPSL